MEARKKDYGESSKYIALAGLQSDDKENINEDFDFDEDIGEASSEELEAKQNGKSEG